MSRASLVVRVSPPCYRHIRRTIWVQTFTVQDPLSAAMAESQNLRRVVTIRGRSGAVLGLRMVREESADIVTHELLRSFDRRYLDQIRFLGVDNPSGAMFQLFNKILPSLECLFLDSTHLAMNYEKAFGGAPFPCTHACQGKSHGKSCPLMRCGCNKSTPSVVP